MSNNSTQKQHEDKSSDLEKTEVVSKEAQTVTVSSPETDSKKPTNKTYLYGGVALLAIILIGAGIFFYQQNQAKNTNNSPASSNRNANGQRNGANRANFSTISGKVASLVDKNLIVDVANNGGQKIVILSDANTQISKNEDSIKENVLKIDQTISIDGDKNNDTVTAKTITLRQIQGTNPPQTSGNVPPNANPPMMPGSNNPNRIGGGLQNPTNGAQNFIFGKITAIDGNKVTIQSQPRPNPQNNNQGNNTPPPSPTSTTILITDNTKYKQQTNLKISDIKTDQSVTVTGMADPTGSITARSVTIE